MNEQLYSIYFNKNRVSIVMTHVQFKDIERLKSKYDDWFTIVVKQCEDKGILIKIIE